MLVLGVALLAKYVARDLVSFPTRPATKPLTLTVAEVADLATLTLPRVREPTLASSSVTYSIKDPAFSAPTSIPEASISQPLTIDDPRAPSWCSGPSCGWDL